MVLELLEGWKMLERKKSEEERKRRGSKNALSMPVRGKKKKGKGEKNAIPSKI